MTFVLDASAMMALLLKRAGAAIVEAALADEGARVFAHRQNVLEVWYHVHRRGALAKWLQANPKAQNAADPFKPDLSGADFFASGDFDSGAGDVAANDALATLEAVGVQFLDTMDAAFWQDVARLKSQFRRVSVADCFGVATARRLNAPFLTSDKGELTPLESAGIVEILWIR